MSNSDNPGVQPWWERPSVCAEHRASDTGVQPWCERPSLCAEHSPRGCHYSFFTQLECQTEIGEDGVPIKRCEMLRKRLLNCPGREPMVDEQLKEEVTSYAGTGPPVLEGEQQEGYNKQGQRQPQSSDMGEALEQVIRLAEDLQEGFLPENKRNRVRCDTPPPATSVASAVSPYEGQSSREVGLLSRLFKGNRMTNPRSCSEVHWAANSSGYDVGGEKEAPWRDYAKDFQDV
ncbi:hypothetical protein Ndes2526B_g05681 [Nannochloris sp. 'desiccata']|nr:hypothetical protein KSW81_007522 [Chlorella desiccata (nom. nud.)]KAH7618757.1 hypothetical protein NADE_005606 [Chlorella desiccata (nom. nud.)]